MKYTICLSVALISALCGCVKEQEFVQSENFLGSETLQLPIKVEKEEQSTRYELRVNDSISYYRVVKNDDQTVMHWFTINKLREGPFYNFRNGLKTKKIVFYRDTALISEEFFYDKSGRLDSVTCGRCDAPYENGFCNSYPIGKLVYRNGNPDYELSSYYTVNSPFYPVSRQGSNEPMVFNFYSQGEVCLYTQCTHDEFKSGDCTSRNTLSKCRLTVRPAPAEFMGMTVVEGNFYFCDRMLDSTLQCVNYIPIYHPFFVMDSLLYDKLF